MLNQQIREYNARINQQGNLEAHTSTLKVIPGFTSFPGSPESTATVKVASNVQRCNPMPLVLSENNCQLIFLGHNPNVHLIPSGNAHNQNKSICDLPFFATQSLRNPVTLFRVDTHLVSYLESPVLRDSSLGKASQNQKINNRGIYLPQNHHTGHSMLMAINGHYWVPVSHNGPGPEVLYQHIAACSNFFCCFYQLLQLISTTQPGMFMHSCSMHIISFRFK